MRLFIFAFRHFRSIFIRKLIIRKRNCKSWRRNCKSWLWLFSLKKALIPPHLLTNFEIKEHNENGPRFNGVNSRDNLPKTIKNELKLLRKHISCYFECKLYDESCHSK